jgi:hypothetical protein
MNQVRAAIILTLCTVLAPITPRSCILTSEGKSAGRGAHSYIVNGEMRDGFALLAHPAVYGSSGVMSFMVNQDGRVYQKDLGPQTATIAAKITRFSPDSGWKKVE